MPYFTIPSIFGLWTGLQCGGAKKMSEFMFFSFELGSVGFLALFSLCSFFGFALVSVKTQKHKKERAPTTSDFIRPKED
jgi:hypothetical protein